MSTVPGRRRATPAYRRGLPPEGKLVPLMRFLAQAIQGLAWVWERIGRPVWRPVWRVACWIGLRYQAVWERAVHRKDGALSRPRAAAMLLATGLFVVVLPEIVALMAEAASYAATSKREVIYLTSSQEVEKGNVHNVEGCDSLPCTEHTAAYFRVRPSLFHDIWALVDHRTLFYPDFVAAAVPSGLTRCEILTYGIRMKLLSRMWDVFPDMLEVKCDLTARHETGPSNFEPTPKADH